MHARKVSTQTLALWGAVKPIELSDIGISRMLRTQINFIKGLHRGTPNDGPARRTDPPPVTGTEGPFNIVENAFNCNGSPYGFNCRGSRGAPKRRPKCRTPARVTFTFLSLPREVTSALQGS